MLEEDYWTVDDLHLMPMEEYAKQRSYIREFLRNHPDAVQVPKPYSVPKFRFTHF